MRSILLLCLLAAGVGCSSSKHVKMKPNELNGTWKPVKQEIAGKQLPAVAFEKQKLIISDNKYTVVAESVDKGEVTFKDGKMDIYGKEGVNAGKHFTAIYEYKNGELTVCYNLSGDSYPTAFETSSQPMLFLSVFHRE